MELESTLLIIPPQPVQAFAYPLREEFDPDSFVKVPAHFTIFYPFVAAVDSDEAGDKLRPVCKKHKPFDVTLDHYGHFDDAVFLEPADLAPLQALYQSVAKVYPEYAREGWHPHLTLGRAKDPKKIKLPDPPEFTFTIDEIRIYVGSPVDQTAPYIPRVKIPLG